MDLCGLVWINVDHRGSIYRTARGVVRRRRGRGWSGYRPLTVTTVGWDHTCMGRGPPGRSYIGLTPVNYLG